MVCILTLEVGFPHLDDWFITLSFGFCPRSERSERGGTHSLAQDILDKNLDLVMVIFLLQQLLGSTYT